MSEEKRKSASGNFVICDVQEDYAGHLFQRLARQFEGEYQFHLFCDIEKMNEFAEKTQIQVLLIGEEYGEEAVEKAVKSGNDIFFICRYGFTPKDFSNKGITGKSGREKM